MVMELFCIISEGEDVEEYDWMVLHVLDELILKLMIST